MGKNRNTFISIIVIVLLIIAGTFYYYSKKTPLASDANSQLGSVQDNSQSSTPAAKFSDQPYYQNAFLISGDLLSAEAQQALNGFQLSKIANSDGSTQIILKALKAGYQDQQYTLQPGQQLYFIEKFSADDNTVANEDNNAGDDMAVVVDASGNVVGQPANWTLSSSNPSSAQIQSANTQTNSNNSQNQAPPAQSTNSSASNGGATESVMHNYSVTANDTTANPLKLYVKKGDNNTITFNVQADGTYHGGLEFKGPNLDTGAIAPGSSGSLNFIAKSSFTLIPYWPSSGIQKPYNISVIVQ